MDIKDIRKPFPFLRLPPELRNRIYHLTLCAPGEIYPAALDAKVRIFRNSDKMATLSICTDLLGACKETQAEAAPVLYGSNAFRFTNAGKCVNLSSMYPFLVKMGRRNRLHLRHLTVCIPVVPRWMWEKYDGTAQVLGDSFDLLSLNHSLHVLELNFLRLDGVQIGRAYKDFFTLGFLVVEKLRKVKNIKQLLLTGDLPGHDFKIRRTTSTMLIASLTDEMLVGKEKEGRSSNEIEISLDTTAKSQSSRKTVTQRLASLEKSLEGLAAIRQDSALRVEGPGTVLERQEPLKNNLITETKIAEIVEEKLLQLQGSLASVTQMTGTTNGLVALERDLAARLIEEKASRQSLETSVAGLASKADIARTIKAEMKSVEKFQQRALAKIGDTVIAEVKEMFKDLGWTEEIAEMVLEELNPHHNVIASKEQVEDFSRNLVALKKKVDELSSRI
ncbi:MAG: hypothetical protein LQ347_003778 [Umbilicaria vellea]|nr:MAG: hypothetical protein LQ347_003778 [Umbilicaria vellea]